MEKKPREIKETAAAQSIVTVQTTLFKVVMKDFSVLVLTLVFLKFKRRKNVEIQITAV